MILSRLAAVAAAFVVVLGLSACNEPSKEELIQKTRGITARDELVAAIGQPSDISKFGPLERWTYEASNGRVVFLITGSSVALQTTESTR